MNSQPKRSPHRANGEGKTNREHPKLNPAVSTGKSVLDFMRSPSLATFTRAFPQHFSVGPTDTSPKDFIPDTTDEALDRIQEELIRAHEERAAEAEVAWMRQDRRQSNNPQNLKGNQT